MRLIDAYNFLDLFYVASAGQDKNFIEAVEMVIEDTPTIDAEPVRHGQWKVVTVPKKYGGVVILCSECDMTGTRLWNFCPMCGAKMDGDENGQ